MLETILPENNVSAATIVLDGKDVLVGAKNGSKVTYLKGSLKGSWYPLGEEEFYGDAAPVVSKVGKDVAVFATTGKQPVLKGLSSSKFAVLTSPYLKKAMVSGRAVELNGEIFVPAVGVPYGCKLYSPVVFSSTDMGESWDLKGFVAISEDFGAELRGCKIIPYKGYLVAFLESRFPLVQVYLSVSADGAKWSEPKATGIYGKNATPVVVNDRIYMVCSEDHLVCVYRAGGAIRWEKVFVKGFTEGVSYIDAFESNGSIVVAVTLGNGRTKILDVPVG